MVLEILSYGFMQNAILTSVFIALACSLLGVFLVLKRYALIGDGVAHIAFGGVAFGLLFDIMPFLSALGFGIAGALGILKLKEKANIYSDSSIGIISHAALGFGIFLASIAHGFNVDLLSYLFGNILTISNSEVIISIVLAVIVISIIILFYYDLFFITFDEVTAKTSGIKVKQLNNLLIFLTAITIVASMKVIGLMLASALIIIPPSTALLLNKKFKTTLIISALISISSMLVGLFISYVGDIAASGAIVLLNFALFLIALSYAKIIKTT
jgi:zinc transport system permease protein